MMPDLPGNTKLAPGRLEIEAPTATAMLESLMTLALIMQNDLDHLQAAIEPSPKLPEVSDTDLLTSFAVLRQQA